jgi:hypothetical protein
MSGMACNLYLAARIFPVAGLRLLCADKSSSDADKIAALREQGVI